MAVLKCWLLVVLVLAVTSSSCVVADDKDVTVTTAVGAALLQVEGERLGELSKQVAETNRALEELLATKLRDVHYASIIGELRAEIDALRRDMHQLKEETAANSIVKTTLTSTTVANGETSTSSENEQKTLHWLQSSLAEMKGEIVDLNRSVNVSLQLQQQQEAAGQFHLMRSDVTALQAQAADGTAQRQQINQSIHQVQQDVERLDQRYQINAAQLERIENNMADLRLEVQMSRKMLDDHQQHTIVHYEEPVVNQLKTKKNQRKTRSVLPEEEAEEDENNNNNMRHHRQEMKHQVQTLKKMVKTLASEQHDLQRQMIVLSRMRTTTESNVNKMELELQAVLKRIEGEHKCSGNSEDIVQLSGENRRLAETMDKLSLRVSGVDQVQSSTLQLFEAMERMEERYDESIGELQREVSKLEFNDGQLTSSVHTLREDHNSQSDMVKALRSTTALLQEQIQADQIRSALLLTKLTNNTLAVINQNHGQQVQNYRLTQIEQSIQTGQSIEDLRQSLSHLEEKYNTLTHNLPHDCREVSSTGMNFVLPRGSSEVVKVYCDQETSGGGWTVVQRRTDGKEDFNRNWAAYKSGFGSVHSEFWLGNDQLHQMTRDNTTMLRVDLWDIYGQYWWAEYDSFFVDSENEGYAVQFQGYTGNASDAMASYHQAMKFSTRDNDQDLSNTNCADSYQGGWWYSHCQHVNINGKYALGLTWYDSLENEWIALAKVEMKIRDKRIFNQQPEITTATTSSSSSTTAH